MDLRQWWMLYGTEGLDRLAEAVRIAKPGSKCSRAYLQQLSWGYRYPSVDFAMLLVELTNGELDLQDVLFKQRKEHPERYRPPRKERAA